MWNGRWEWGCGMVGGGVTLVASTEDEYAFEGPLLLRLGIAHLDSC